MQKWNLREKLGKKNLDWKSQPRVKVNGQSQRSKSTVWSTMTSAGTVVDDVSGCRGGWRQQMTWQMTSPRADVNRGTLARAGVWQRMATHGGSWRRVTVTPRLLVARGGAWEVRWRRNFTEREIGEISFWWCNLWSNWRSGSGGGGKAVVFDVLKSQWRQWCCSQQQLQLTPKKTRLLKSDTPKD